LTTKVVGLRTRKTVSRKDLYKPTHGAGDAITAAKASDATNSTTSSSDPHPTSGATARTIPTAVLGVVITTIIFFAA